MPHSMKLIFIQLPSLDPDVASPRREQHGCPTSSPAASRAASTAAFCPGSSPRRTGRRWCSPEPTCSNSARRSRGPCAAAFGTNRTSSGSSCSLPRRRNRSISSTLSSRNCGGFPATGSTALSRLRDGVASRRAGSSSGSRAVRTEIPAGPRRRKPCWRRTSTNPGAFDDSSATRQRTRWRRRRERRPASQDPTCAGRPCIRDAG